MALNIDRVKACYRDLLLIEHILAASQQDIGKVVEWPFCIKPLPNKM